MHFFKSSNMNKLENIRTERFSLDDIIILDDFIPKTYSDLIENIITTGEIPFFYSSDIGHEDAINSQNRKNYGFNFWLKKREENTFAGLHYLFLPMMYEAFNKIGREISYIDLGRLFLTTSGVIEKEDVLHVDQPRYHIGLIYYVNDNDGESLFSDKIFNEESEPLDYWSSPYYLTTDKNINIINRVTSKKGRAVIFNGLRYHTAKRSSSGVRFVTNYNIL
tara:strand:- start:4542 stop:5204 length:663 start_codon:yes stop_codon:yes gene_type:complete